MQSRRAQSLLLFAASAQNTSAMKATGMFWKAVAEVWFEIMANELADAVHESAHKFELHLKLFGLMPMSNAAHMSANNSPRLRAIAEQHAAVSQWSWYLAAP